MPVTIRLGLPLALLVGLAYWSYSATYGARAVLRITSSEALALGEASVELFRYEPGGYSSSPSAKIGDFDCPEGGLSLSMDELGGVSALARISAPGHGVGFALLEQGVTTVELGEPASARGRIQAAPALLAGARVQAFGGGSRGVLLLETETDGQGGFVLEGFSSNIAFLLVRVFQSGFAVAEMEWEVGGRQPLELTLEPTQPLSGEIEFCPGFEPQEVELRAYRVPGVHATSDGSGRFRIEHLSPEPIRTALLLSSLPEEFTHRRVQVTVSDTPVKILIQRSASVRGRVVNGNNGEGVSGAKVLHEHGPKGHEVVTCAKDGSFEIGRLPSGEVRLDAEIIIEVLSVPENPNSPKRRKLIQGHVDLDLIEGETLDSVVITFY